MTLLDWVVLLNAIVILIGAQALLGRDFYRTLWHALPWWGRVLMGLALLQVALVAYGLWLRRG